LERGILLNVLLYGTYQAVLMTAMAEGIQHLGHRVSLRNQMVYRVDDCEKADVVVLMGLHGGGLQALADYRQRGMPVLIVDYGYVKRGTQMGGHNISLDKYYSMSLNGLNGRSDPLPSPMSSTRWDSFGVELAEWRTDGKYILVCGQKENDAAIGDLNPRLWAARTIEHIQQITRRPVVFRPHPESPSQRRPIGVPHSTCDTFAEALRDAYAVVAYNSNALVEATIAGVPTFALGNGSMMQKCTNTDLRDLDDPQTFSREQWAYDLAWRQYTVEEFKAGLPWQYAIERSVEAVHHEVPRLLDGPQPRKDDTHHDKRGRGRPPLVRPSRDDSREPTLPTG
jgi:hypothetical protein